MRKSVHTSGVEEGPNNLHVLLRHRPRSISPSRDAPVTLAPMLTAFGAAAVTFMMLMYALERRGRGFILAFGCGCLLSSAYGFLAGTWPFGVVELIWAGVAFNRYRDTSHG
jgi:hypothetical protein